MLILHLCTEYSISLEHFFRCVQILVQQSFVAFLRMAAHILHLPSVVGIGWRSVEIITQPHPESSAGQETHSKVQRIFFFQQVSVERQILPHSWSLLDGRLTLEKWQYKASSVDSELAWKFKVFVFLFLPWKNIVWAWSLQSFCSLSICLSWTPWVEWAELLSHSFSSAFWSLAVDSRCPVRWSWCIAPPEGCRSPSVSGSQSRVSYWRCLYSSPTDIRTHLPQSWLPNCN